MTSQLDIEVLLSEYLLSAESIQHDTTVSSVTNKIPAAIQQQEDDIICAVDFLYGKTTEGALTILDAAGSISKVVSATSQRSVYLVKGSSSFASRGKGRTSSSEDTYLCIIPQSSDELPIYFCSCRSFLERNRHPTNESSCLCKHLLALRLMPVLQVQPVLVETASDDEFSNMLMQRIPFDSA
jgi:hypothetical protein